MYSVNKYVFKFFLNFSEFLSARSVAGSEFQAYYKIYTKMNRYKYS